MEIEKLIDKISDEIYQKFASEIETPSETKPAGGIHSIIDHTILNPDATVADVTRVCNEAREYRFASVCVNTGYVPLVAKLLQGSVVKVCCVVGFPLGACTTRTKVEETKEAVLNGAQEVDMVINIGAAKSGDWGFVQSDIAAVVAAATPKAIVKVIIETCLLTDEEKVSACKAAKAAGAHFVKTSTGFSKGGAKAEDIALMRRTVGPEMGVKASGGIRDYEAAKKMVNAGATRIGASAGIAIVKAEAAEKGNGAAREDTVQGAYPRSSVQ